MIQEQPRRPPMLTAADFMTHLGEIELARTLIGA